MHFNTAAVMGKTVLVVDNDQTVRAMVRYTLSTEHYTVLEARDGVEAFLKLEDGVKADLIIVGVNMDEMECVSLLKEIRKLPGCNNMPILMIAPENMLSKQMEWKKAGATCWVTKPFTAEQLLKMVEMVMF